MNRPDQPLVAFRPTTPCQGPQSGSVLIWALFFVSLTTGILIAHSLEIAANRRQMDTRYRRIDQANMVAEAGLTDATSYLRRQTLQPVVTFTPQLDLAADPPVNDTLDPAVGLVREFEVHGNLWGRYEVRTSEARDVSTNYGQPAGSVWDVGARGYLYELVDRSRPYDQAPNRVVSVQTVFTELRGVKLTLPSTAAIVVDSAAQVTMLGNGLVDGKTSPAIAYRRPPGPLVVPILDATITGTPASVAVAGLTVALPNVIGMREDRLQNLADITVVSSRQLRGRILDDEVVYVPGDLVLDPSTVSLRGRALLVINGNLTATADNNSDFRGVVFAKGDIVIEGPFTFGGTMVGGGLVKFGGTADLVKIEASPADVSALQVALRRYRVSKDVRPAASTGAYATTTDLATVTR